MGGTIQGIGQEIRALGVNLGHWTGNQGIGSEFRALGVNLGHWTGVQGIGQECRARGWCKFKA
jgi:hypothetical protein